MKVENPKPRLISPVASLGGAQRLAMRQRGLARSQHALWRLVLNRSLQVIDNLIDLGRSESANLRLSECIRCHSSDQDDGSDSPNQCSLLHPLPKTAGKGPGYKHLPHLIIIADGNAIGL